MRISTLVSRSMEASNAEEVIRALDEIGRRCRFGDLLSDRRDNDVDDDDDNFETNDDDVKCVVNGSVSVGGGGPFPNLTIFQRTSLIYTLMSFLGVLDPASAILRSSARGSEILDWLLVMHMQWMKMWGVNDLEQERYLNLLDDAISGGASQSSGRAKKKDQARRTQWKGRPKTDDGKQRC